MRDPYSVLGLPHGADLATVKARYRELALLHHPDKQHGVSAEERERKTELFKEMTVAYQVILEGGGGRGAGAARWTDANGAPMDADGHWSRVWERVERMFQQKEIWSFMGDVLKDVATKYRTARAEATPHVFDLTVGLRDIYENRAKKLRLFLKDLTEPVVVRAYCGSYPEYRTTYVCAAGAADGTGAAEYDIRIRLHAREDPTLPYTIDTLFGTKDLYTEIAVSWAETITGTTRQLPYLSGGTVDVVVPPFWRGGPIVLKGYGATGHASESMYVSVLVDGPTADAWQRFAAADAEAANGLLAGLARLSAFETPPAADENPSGDEAPADPKTT